MDGDYVGYEDAQSECWGRALGSFSVIQKPGYEIVLRPQLEVSSLILIRMDMASYGPGLLVRTETVFLL
jgi:hypothetical protein